MTLAPIKQEAIVRAIGPAQCLTTAEIAAAIGRPNKQVATACSKLVTGAVIERVEVGCFRLTPLGRDVVSGARDLPRGCPQGPHTGPKARPPDSLRQRAWAAMRLTRRFTAGEIATLAGAAADKSPETHLVSWFGMLVRAGYLAVLPRRVPGTAPTSNGHKCWTLLRDTGEIAPRVRLNGTYYDYNTGEGEPRAKGRAAECSQ